MSSSTGALQECVRAARDVGGGIEPWHLGPLVIIALVVMGIVRRRVRSGHAAWIEMWHPLMDEAAEKAQASWPLMRELHTRHPGELTVKFRVVSPESGATTDLAWGRLLEAGTSEFTATVDGTTSSARPSTEGSVTMPSDRLLDWRYVSPTGEVRGGFSVQAQIRLHRQRRARLPAEAASMQGRFVDR